MATFSVKQGKRYRATITLGWLERWAGNETIAEKLRAAGFSEISVSGSGGTRVAEALWTGADSTGEMPAQITEVIEICKGGPRARAAVSAEAYGTLRGNARTSLWFPPHPSLVRSERRADADVVLGELRSPRTQ